MKRKIRILINTLECGGAERVLINLLKTLPEEQYEVSLVTVTGGAFLVDVPRFVRYHQIVKGSSKISKIKERTIYKMPAWLFNLIYLSGKHDVEIAYLEGFPTKMMAHKCRSVEKTYAFVHSDFSVKYSGAAFYKNECECRNEYETFTNACFVSQAALDGFKRRVGNLSNAKVIHNIIDFRGINRKAKEHPFFTFNRDVFKIVSVGRLASVKGYDRLIRIAKRLTNCVRFQIIIIGEGDERKKLEDLLSKNDISTMMLAGFNLNPYAVMAEADLYICSSLYEGYSTSVAESVGLGVPVLTTECAGMHEILDGGNCGMIVENNEEALYIGLKKLLENPDLLNMYKQNAQKEQERLLSMGQLGEYVGILK